MPGLNSSSCTFQMITLLGYIANFFETESHYALWSQTHGVAQTDLKFAIYILLPPVH